MDKDFEEFVATHEKNELYTVGDFFLWHGRLTHSCARGRREFLERFDLKKNDMCNASFFLDITMKNDDASNTLFSELFEYYKGVSPVYKKMEEST